MSHRVTRRQFLKTAGTAASVTVIGRSLFDVDSLLAAPFMRRDIGKLTATDPIIKSYRKAIKAMQALPSSNPLSWAYQAAIHGTTLSGSLPAWNTCEHGTDFFWPWHRMYLYWFERIIRKMSGDYGWALPYWNWSSPSERQLPPMFRDPTSELFTSHRNAAMNNGTGSLPASDVDYSAAFALISFSGANGIIQGTPHGDVHVDIGGWMGSVPTAGQDPIFFLHHCNMDRLWNLWLAQGGGRTNPLSDATWKSTKFTFFDENGHQVQMTSCDVLRAALQLKYTYEGEPPQVNEYCERFRLPPIYLLMAVLIRLPIPEVVLGSGRVTFPIEIKEIRQRLAVLAEDKTLFLEFDKVEADRQPGVVWEVYVGLPANSAPDPKGPYYVGNLSLFGSGIRSEAQHGYKPARFSFAINRAIVASLRENAERIPVTLVPHGILIDGKPSRPQVASPVRIGAASLNVATQKRR